MISVIEHIEYLSLWHDCVVVPGWGALIAQHTPARFDNRLIGKPCRSLCFNADIRHNDGLLAQSLVRRHHIAYEAAVRLIDRQVAALRQQLADTGEVALGRLGTFECGPQGQPVFNPFVNRNACDEYYGLTPLPLATLAAQEQDTATAVRTPRFWRVAASVAALLALTVLLTTPIVGHRIGNHDLASLQPQVERSAESTLPFDWDGVDADLAVALPQSAAEAVQTGDGTHYTLVIASLNNEQQVEAFKAAHPDIAPQMKVMRTGRYWRVYIAQSDDYATLAAIAKRLPHSCADYWICD